MGNPANDPAFLTALLDRMDKEPATRKAVHQMFASGDLSFLMHDTQLKMSAMLETTTSNEILILCSRQLGKSFWGLCLAISYCLKNPNKVVRIFAPTEVQAREICDDTLRVIQQFAPDGLIVKRKADKQWGIGQSEIRVGPLSSAHIDGKRGGNAGLVICEEGGFTESGAYASAIGNVINPQLLRSGGKLVHITTPSEDANHFIHTNVLPRCTKLGAIAQFTIHDNPQLSPEQIASARDRCDLEETWQREYLAQIVRSEVSSAIPEFSNDVVKEFTLPERFNCWIAGDWGGVKDKTAFLLMAYDFERAKVLVLDERCFPKHTPTKDIVAQVLAMEKQWGRAPPRYVDLPGQLRVDLISDYKFAVTFPRKADFESSINLIRSAIARDQLEIHPRCKFLIHTLSFARVNPQRSDFQRNESVGHADAAAALFYGLRHINKQSPYPANHGLHSERHHFSHTSDLPATAATFQKAFGPRRK